MRKIIELTAACITMALPTVAMKPVSTLPVESAPILVTEGTQRGNSIELTYHIPSPQIFTSKQQTINRQSTMIASISTAPQQVIPGEPMIPKIPVRVVIPFGKTVDYIEAIPGNEDTISLDKPLAFGEWFNTSATHEGTITALKREILESDAPYPENYLSDFSMQKAYGVSIVTCNLYPLRAMSKSQRLSMVNILTIKIHLKEEQVTSDIRIDVERFKERGLSAEENTQALLTYPTELHRAETVDYVLITSEEIASDNSVSPNVNDLIRHRKKQDLACKIVTMEEIRTGYTGAADNEKIRNFIKFAYNNWNTKFVTLGGDIDVVDFFEERAQYNFENRLLPTDLPYQCLDGDSWNGDFEAEVYVSRMAVENAQEFSNQLHKILQYEKVANDAPQLRKTLGAGQEINWQINGSEAIELLMSEVFPSDWDNVTMYDKDGKWGQTEAIDKLATHEFSYVNHDGHGSEKGTFRVQIGEAGNLTNTHYPFLYSLSCTTGDFKEDCIAEHFFAEHKVGGFCAGVMNSDVGLSNQNGAYGPSPELQRSFWSAYWDKKMEYFSQMNAYSHQMNTDNKFTCFTTNMFGDAAMRCRAKDYLLGTAIEKNSTIGHVGAVITGIAVTSKKISFHLTESANLKIGLYGINGQQVYSRSVQKYEAGQQTLTYSVDLAKGMYVLQLSSAMGTSSYKIEL